MTIIQKVLLLSLIIGLGLDSNVLAHESSTMWRPLTHNFAKPPAQHLGAGVLRETENTGIRQLVSYGGISSGNYKFDTPWKFDLGTIQQWATSPVNASSSYCTSSGQWCPKQALGQPESISCGDFDSAWAPRPAGDVPEWIRVSFVVLSNATKLEVYETYNAPFVIELVFYDENGLNHTFSVNDTTSQCPGVFSMIFDPPTPYYVKELVLYTSSKGWEEINAIRLSGIVNGLVGSENGTVTSTTESNPPSRNGMVAGYDSKKDRMIIYGGRSSSYLGDTYEFRFENNEWSKLTGTAPSPRHAPASVVIPINATNNGMLIFGGRCGDRCFFNELWLLDFSNDTWNQIAVVNESVPMPSYGPAMSLLNNTHAVVFGGESIPADGGYIMNNDLWLLDIRDIYKQNQSRWTLATPQSGTSIPSTRSFASAASYDGKFYLVAGKHVTGQSSNFQWTFEDDIWCFDFGQNQWYLLSDGDIPSRAEAVSTLDLGIPSSPRIIVYGGRTSTEDLFTSGTLRDDVWAFGIEEGNWTQLGVQPKERANHASVLIEDKLMIIGGESSSSEMLSMTPVLIDLNPLSQYKTTSLTVAGTPPEPRTGMTAVLLSSNRVLLFGGLCGKTYSNELWELSTDTGLGGSWTWTKISPSGDVPVARAYHSVVILNRKLIVYGGLGASGPLSSLWEFDFSSKTWLIPSIKTSSNPSARFGHVALATKNGMIIMGGSQTNEDLGELKDVWLFDSGNNSWTSYGNILGAGLAGFRVEEAGSLPLIHGGHTLRAGRYSGDVTFVEGMMYAFKSNSDPFKSAPLPYSYLSPGRYGHSFVLLGRELFVFGGENVEKKTMNDLSVFSDSDWECGPGTYQDLSSSCALCPAGTHNDGFGAASCTSCSVGFTGQSKGGTSESPEIVGPAPLKM